jgi:DUF2075 family protein/predicted GIY-YIG superfamily endonuclease
MFNITTYDYIKKDFDNWNIQSDYHCVYILENGKDAYIGETNDPVRRAKEHNAKISKKKHHFINMHIITGELSELSPSKHYQDLLIRLMTVDRKFNIINGKQSERPHYSRKNEFELYFDELWIKLEAKGLVKTKEFRQIINSNTYKYSPYTILTENQHNCLTSIVHTIDSGETAPHKKSFKTRPILIAGDAGTGKTVVAASLFYYLRNNVCYKDKKIALVYANPSTRSEMQEVFKNIKGLHKDDIISPINITKQNYDIAICDEAQRLRQAKNLGFYSKIFKQVNERLCLDNTHDELDWILQNTNCQILFYDVKQSTAPSDIDPNYFKKRLYEDKRGIRPIKLKEQMRIKAGSGYVPYIYNILYQKTNVKEIFGNYEFKLFTSFSSMVKLLKKRDRKVGLCRLSTGYAWEWKGKKDETLVDISIDGIDIKWNSQTSGWLSDTDTNEEMGSIYTLPGLDLNYAGVVIGPDLYFDEKNYEIKVNKDNFFDNKVKSGVTDEELKIYILNTYAVLLTRGISGTYVYVCDNALREYLKKIIPCEDIN